jgi:chorismate mutase / prephenate dehydrogenase
MDLEEIRRRLSQIDAELLALVGERQRLSHDVARVKRATGRPTRDFARERDVIMNARAAAERSGVSPQVAEQILRLLIRSSLTTQEQDLVAAQGLGAGKRALIIGGAGKMGRWFAGYLASQGFAVEIADPSGAGAGYPCIDDWQASALDQDLVVVATPLGITGEVLAGLAARRPRGLVFDIGSLKTPLRAGLEALVAAGVRTASIHPMFGPDTELLSGRHVIHIDLGDEKSLHEAQGLFASTMAEQVVTTLDDHDRLIAYVLGLSHAVNIAFFTALAGSGEAAPRLVRLSSTTFDAQFDVAAKVASESPALYFEIQRLNQYGAESLEALSRAVERLRELVETGDAPGFEQMMLTGRAYVAGRTMGQR